MNKKESKRASGAYQGPQEQALVVGRRGPVMFVETDKGNRLSCLGRGPGKAAVVGDRVDVRLEAQTELSEALVTAIHPRKSELKRQDIHRRRPQVLAANIDQILVVSAAFPEMREGLVDRYIIAAHAQGIRPEVVFNKTDLLADEQANELIRKRLSIYQKLGYRIHFVSARTEDGLLKMRQVLENRLSILVGHSGVGKTSLLNALFPDLKEEVRALSEASGRGQHTTTTSSLYPLVEGGAVIDSPGIRSFGLSGIEQNELRDYYPEFVERADECRFANCQHLTEPGCAVRAALEIGEVSAVRYENYRRIRDSIGGDDSRR